MSTSLRFAGVTTPVAHRPRTPRTFAGPWSEVEACAVEADEPLFVPVTPYVDDRGWSLMNLMAGALSSEGQINFSVQHPSVIKAWHRHRLQTDFWTCVSGHLKAGVYRESDGSAWMLLLGERQPGVLVIPPGLWHGATAVGNEPAALLYYVTHAYNPADPDEERRPFDSVRGFPWKVRHG